MGVEAAGIGQGGVEPKLPILDEAGPSKLEAGGHHLRGGGERDESANLLVGWMALSEQEDC